MVRLRRIALVAATTCGCAGGTYVVDAPLRATPALDVSGDLGMAASSCNTKLPPRRVGLRSEKAAEAALGPWMIRAADPRKTLRSDAVLGDQVLHDYQKFLAWYYQAKSRPRSAAELAVVGLRLASGPDLDLLLEGIGAFLDLPGTIEQTITFSIFAAREDHIVTGVCRSTDIAHYLGSFDDPRVSLVCRFVPSVDHVPRELRVSGFGTWANFGFKGSLAGRGPAERAVFSSQNVTILGAGGVRGFDLRRDGAAPEQLAAVSFFDTVAEGRTLPRAWLGAQDSTGWTDAIATTMALAYLFPWPTSCDSYWLRGDAARQRGVMPPGR